MKCFKTYDDFKSIVLDNTEENIKDILKIQYIILFRMWELLEESFDDFDGWDNCVLIPVGDEDGLSWEEYDDYVISDLLMLNYDKIYAYSEHKCCDLKEKVEGLKCDGRVSPAFLYDFVLDNHKSIFETFFLNSSPLLGVKKYDEQVLPSLQIQDHNASIVLNEVGTGKTISAVYAISDIIEKCIASSREAHVLIVCPSNLKNKWEEDIRFNLGRYSYVMKRGEESQSCFAGDYKKVFFHGNEHCIFIMDNISSKKGEMCTFKQDSKADFIQQLFGWTSVNEPWDLIVIDECHLCNKNYSSLRAKNIMLLTATPIVTFNQNDQGDDIDSLEIYRKIIKSVLQRDIRQGIKPLEDRIPDVSDLFTNYFREDLSIQATERMIVFKETERIEGYADMVTRIADKKNWLVADHFAQDDEYLVSHYKAICRDDMAIDVDVNPKKEVLGEIIEEMEEEKDCPAIIVFCEHQEVVQNLYSYFKEDGNRVVAMKCGSMEKMNRDGSGNVILSLHQYIRKQSIPVILIITGEIGGTGLNMGDFDAVVHYELPYTSIALEQRFGRIDRMEGGREGIKKMYFILNKEKPDSRQSGVENRFFWFCVSKLNSTCKYLPVRNTVLFYPKMAERFQRQCLNTIDRISRDALGNEAIITGRELDKRIRADYERLYGMPLEGKIEDWYGYNAPDEIMDSGLREDIISYQDNQQKINAHARARDTFRRFINEYDHIVSLFDPEAPDFTPMSPDDFTDDIVLEEQDDSAVDTRENDDNDTGKSDDETVAELLMDEEETETVKAKEESDLQKRYDLQRSKILRINPNKFSDKLSNGIYYYENDGLIITTVEQYREEAANEQE